MKLKQKTDTDDEDEVRLVMVHNHHCVLSTRDISIKIEADDSIVSCVQSVYVSVKIMNRIHYKQACKWRLSVSSQFVMLTNSCLIVLFCLRVCAWSALIML